jgi:transcriptional antiterminator RfaH
MKFWFAVHTKAKQEEKAKFNLVRQGYDVYLPRYLKRRSHARKIENVPAPLFPRYLFVGMDTDTMSWSSIRSTLGVDGIVKFGEAPASIDQDIISELKRRESEDGYLAVNHFRKFSVGELVEFTGGAFDAMVGQLLRLGDDQRVTLLMDVMGRKVKVNTTTEFIAAT